MIKINMYSIRDSVSDSFGPVFFATNDDIMKRDLTFKISNDPYMKNNIKDYSVYLVGVFDSKSGQIDSVEKTHIIECFDLFVGDNDGKSKK